MYKGTAHIAMIRYEHMCDCIEVGMWSATKYCSNRSNRLADDFLKTWKAKLLLKVSPRLTQLIEYMHWQTTLYRLHMNEYDATNVRNDESYTYLCIHMGCATIEKGLHLKPMHSLHLMSWADRHLHTHLHFLLSWTHPTVFLVLWPSNTRVYVIPGVVCQCRQEYVMYGDKLWDARLVFPNHT